MNFVREGEPQRTLDMDSDFSSREINNFTDDDLRL